MHLPSTCLAYDGHVGFLFRWGNTSSDGSFVGQGWCDVSLLQTWTHAQRRCVQLRNEKEAVLRDGELRGIPLNPEESYSRAAAGAL